MCQLCPLCTCSSPPPRSPVNHWGGGGEAGTGPPADTLSAPDDEIAPPHTGFPPCGLGYHVTTTGSSGPAPAPPTHRTPMLRLRVLYSSVTSTSTGDHPLHYCSRTYSYIKLTQSTSHTSVLTYDAEYSYMAPWPSGLARSLRSCTNPFQPFGRPSRCEYKISPRVGRPVMDWCFNVIEWCILNGYSPSQGGRPSQRLPPGSAPAVSARFPWSNPRSVLLPLSPSPLHIIPDHLLHCWSSPTYRSVPLL